MARASRDTGWSGQLVAVEVIFLFTLAALAGGRPRLAPIAPAILLCLALLVVRVRGEWAYGWLAIALRYMIRRRVLASGSPVDSLLHYVHPGAEAGVLTLDGAPVAVIDDAGGPTAVISIGADTAVLPPPRTPFPPLTDLLPDSGPHGPRIRLRLVSTTVSVATPIADAGLLEVAYQQLTGGVVPSYQSVFIAVQARRDPRHGEAVLRVALANAVRRIRYRVERSGVPTRSLPPDAIPRVLAELAYHDPQGGAAEWWPYVTTAVPQIVFKVDGPVRDDLAVALLASAPPFPHYAVTVATAVEGLGHADHTTLPRGTTDARESAADTIAAARAGRFSTATYVRLATAGTSSLVAAEASLRRVLGQAAVGMRRLDGTHLNGLAATLPLGGVNALTEVRELGGVNTPDAPNTLVRSRDRPDANQSASGNAGVMLGTNRRGEPVVARVFRPVPTHLVTVGELRRAQLFVLRCLAVGARLFLWTHRLPAWRRLLRPQAWGSGTPVTVLAPGTDPAAPAASPLEPQLVVLDTAGGRAPSTAATTPTAWRTTLVIRDGVTALDADTLANADLALVAPLSGAESALVRAALGLGEVAGWFSSIPGDMIGAVAPRSTVRWALASPTAFERRILGQ